MTLESEARDYHLKLDRDVSRTLYFLLFGTQGSVRELLWVGILGMPDTSSPLLGSVSEYLNLLFPFELEVVG